MKHTFFNKGVVRGTVRDVRLRKTRANARPYLELQVACHSEPYGRVGVYARLWGQEVVEAFQDAYRKTPEAPWRFDGHCTWHDEKALWGYHLMRFEQQQTMVPRAGFIFIGEIAGFDYPADEDSITIMKLHVVTKGRPDRDETFPLYLPAATALSYHPSQRVHVYGHLRDWDAEAGGSGLVVRPWVEQIRRTT